MFVRAVSSWIERRARDAGHPGGRTGPVVFVQRFDSALQLNVHFHALVLDGVFCQQGPRAAPDFRRIPPPTDDDIIRLTKSLAHRIACCLAKLHRDPGDLEPSPLIVAYAAAVQGTLPFAGLPGTRVPRIGEAESLGHGPTRRWLPRTAASRCRPRRRLLWAELLLRVFHRDQLACPRGGRLYLVALIQQLDVAAKILDHLRLLGPARAPPWCTSPA